MTARRSNVIQLRKRVNGTFSTPASTSLPATLNTTYRLRLVTFKAATIYDDVLVMQP